ncbi:MAG: MFS transporter [Alphaproteobacteria bacterium]|nr:MFS transporter [Alphaproteobacteria bacterium]
MVAVPDTALPDAALPDTAAPDALSAHGAKGAARRVGNALVMFVVTGLSLILLVYVGYGEGKRTYGEFHVAKVITQAGIVRTAMEAFLRDGLPIRQFVGFNSLTGPIVDSEYVDAVTALDTAAKEVFRNVDQKLKNVPRPPPDALSGEETRRYSADGYTHISVPLRSRFEAAGTLIVSSSDAVATRLVDAAFLPLIGLALLLSALFAACVATIQALRDDIKTRWLHVAYAGIFLTMSGVVIWTLISLYSEGAQDKARVLANMLAQRIGEIVQYDLALRDFVGIDTAFADYRKLNPDIAAVALIVDGNTQVHTDPTKLGQPWAQDPRNYAYVIGLGQSTQTGAVGIAVEVPREIVYRQVARSVKNFAAMFIASAFLAGLFLQVASSLKNLRRDEEEIGGPDALRRAALRERAALSSVKPLFFVAVFLEHLTYSFLPQHMQQLASAADLSAGFASAPFMIYYLFFALSLVPSGHFTQRVGPRVAMNGGLILAGVGLLALVLPIGFWGALIARAASGVGQGMLFIGVQSYILAIASAENRTQGNGIIVFGFQGGMISGMAIGSLLVTYLGPAGVFELAGILSFVTASYGLVLVPAGASAPAARQSVAAELRTLFRDVARVLHHSEFIRAMFLIGVPAKAALTGIITFALPLLLARSQYKQEDIGQIVMLYAIGVVGASHYVTRFVDRNRQTVPVLVLGAAASGVAMLVIGLPDWSDPAGAVLGGSYVTWVVILGVIAIGVAHGFVNAPVVTHIAELDLAKTIGVGSVTATYRFLERLGHVAGPILVGQLFVLMGVTPLVIALFGGVTCMLALIFLSAVGGTGGKSAEVESPA